MYRVNIFFSFQFFFLRSVLMFNIAYTQRETLGREKYFFFSDNFCALCSTGRKALKSLVGRFPGHSHLIIVVDYLTKFTWKVFKRKWAGDLLNLLSTCFNSINNSIELICATTTKKVWWSRKSEREYQLIIYEKELQASLTTIERTSSSS